VRATSPSQSIAGERVNGCEKNDSSISSFWQPPARNYIGENAKNSTASENASGDVLEDELRKRRQLIRLMAGLSPEESEDDEDRQPPIGIHGWSGREPEHTP
jgi:hypothetical protein